MKAESAEVGVDVVTDDIIVDAHQESTVADDKDVGGRWLLWFDAIEDELGAVEGLLEGLAVTEVGIDMKIEKIFWPSGGVGAFEFTEAALFEIVVKNNRTAVVDDDFGGLSGALERGSVANVELVVLEFVAQRFGLLNAGGIEGNISLTLGNPLKVPISLAVANEI